jgi:FtsP/CotA-like multicopper oxidase with cupredoxin domain
MRRAWILAALLLACAPPQPELEPARALPEPVPAVDLDPEPGVVEIELVAEVATVELVPGIATEVWAYRDAGAPDGTATVPGPLVTAALGQRLVVHVRNELPQATTVHMHGLRLPDAMDGNPMVAGAIEPGESFTYDVVLRDPGLHWYHPHLYSDEQIQRGLQGPLLVRGPDEPVVASERVLVLDDVALDDDGALVLEPTHDDVMYGRRGNVLLVNGRLPATATAAAGSTERWRLVNTSNGRFFALALQGPSAPPGDDLERAAKGVDTPLRVIGWDGGAVEPYETDVLVIAPGERYDVLATLDGEPGERLELETLPRPDAPGPAADGPYTLLTLELGPPDADALVEPVVPATSVTPLDVDGDTAVRRFELEHVSGTGLGAVFTVNGERWPLNTAIHVDSGDTEVWELVNLGPHEHPFHLHGMPFQVLDRDGASEPTLGWKDTVRIDPHGTTRIAVRYDEPGMWMFHCTIPEHAERGMMGDLHVMEEGG